MLSLLIASILCIGTNYAAAVQQMSAAQKLGFLDWHNQIRSEVALGTVSCNGGNCPSARNMNKLQWDPAVAQVAEDWAMTMATECNMYHNNNRNTQTCAYSSDLTFTHACTTSSTHLTLGENVAYGAGSTFRDGLSISKAWHDTEHDQYIYTTPKPSGTGHFTQIAWADTRYVGCGCAENTCGSWKATYCVCNYAPPGNYGTLPYESGSPASNCDSDRVADSTTGLCGGCPDPSFPQSANGPSSCSNGIDTTATTASPVTTTTPAPVTPTTTTTPAPVTPTTTTTAAPSSGIKTEGFSYSSFNSEYPLYGTFNGKNSYGPGENGYYFYYHSSSSHWMLVQNPNDFSSNSGYSGLYSKCSQGSSAPITSCGGWNNYDNGVQITSIGTATTTPVPQTTSATTTQAPGTIFSIEVSGFTYSGFNGNYPVHTTATGNYGIPSYGPLNNYYMFYNSAYQMWFLVSGEQSVANFDSTSYSNLYSYCSQSNSATIDVTDCNDWSNYDGGVTIIRGSAFGIIDSDTSKTEDNLILGIVYGVSIMAGLIIIGSFIYWLYRKNKAKDTQAKAFKVVDYNKQQTNNIVEMEVEEN